MRRYTVQAIRIIAVCALSWIAARLLRLPDGFWAPITAVVVTQPLLDDTLFAARQRIIGTVLGALAGLVVIFGTQHGLPRMPLFWLALVPLAGATACWPNMRLSVVTLIVTVLVPSAEPSFARPLDRVLEIIIGTVCAILVSVVLDGTPGTRK